MGFWSFLSGAFGSTVETGRCRKCCRSKYYCCQRPLSDNEQVRLDRVSQLFVANKSPEEAAAILVKEDSWHPQATRNCVDRWYGELTEGQGYSRQKSKKKPKRRQQTKIEKLLNKPPPEPIEKPWSILTTRFGDHKKSPTPGDLAAAIHELFNETLSYITPEKYAEHPNARLRCGFKDETLYVLDAYRTGRLVLQQWADQDMEKQLAPDLEIENASKEQVDRVWELLLDGYIDKAKAEFANSD
jgi:hypothetical protein